MHNGSFSDALVSSHKSIQVFHSSVSVTCRLVYTAVAETAEIWAGHLHHAVASKTSSKTSQLEIRFCLWINLLLHFSALAFCSAPVRTVSQVTNFPINMVWFVWTKKLIFSAQAWFTKGTFRPNCSKDLLREISPWGAPPRTTQGLFVYIYTVSRSTEVMSAASK